MPEASDEAGVRNPPELLLTPETYPEQRHRCPTTTISTLFAVSDDTTTFVWLTSVPTSAASIIATTIGAKDAARRRIIVTTSIGEERSAPRHLATTGNDAQLNTVKL